MLKQRILTAGVLLAFFLLAVFYLPFAYWRVFMVLCALPAAYEWGKLAGFDRRGSLVASAVMLALCGCYSAMELAFAGGASPARALFMYMPACLFWVVVVPCWLSRRWNLSRTRAGRGALLALGLYLILITVNALTELRFLSAMALLFVLSLAWVADIAAYFTGRYFGGAKLSPEISPGKTRAGAYGAMIAVALEFLLVQIFQDANREGGLDWKIWLGAGAVTLCLGAGFAILGIMGDLFESLLKRQAGVKDSGNLFPGHGGILDRIDSQLAILPCFMAFYHLFTLAFLHFLHRITE
ncbi:MAG: phosphatidate cytidylyltransferase [Zoogloeaceae bacterium]|jgi:phosphatidate cytidylyltransferase|nr:phosphatidate cytidylyltransferase [Zoogloeaceae bacterium]